MSKYPTVRHCILISKMRGGLFILLPQKNNKKRTKRTKLLLGFYL